MRFRSMATGFLMSAVAALASLTAGVSEAIADPCGNGSAGFASWLREFKSEAAAQGLSEAAINSALAGVTYDLAVIGLDRGQHSFKLSFDVFYARRVNGALIARGRSLMRRYREVLDRSEQRFGVPGEVVMAIWGLETNYGAVSSGRFSILRSLATLAYDCRRSDFFKGQLLDAIRIVQNGDLSPKEMRGGWAGEIGQTQFLPTPYVKYAVDFDGDGHRDLRHSVPDILASTANFLASHGWQRGQPWGPGTANYEVISEWNKADVYDRTIALMAEKIGGRG